MYTVTFAFDLGDCLAIYTGRIVGTYENGYKVTYFEPTVRELLSIDLPESEVIGKGFTPVRMLPLAPFIVETPEPVAVTRLAPAFAFGSPACFGIFTRPSSTLMQLAPLTVTAY